MARVKFRNQSEQYKKNHFNRCKEIREANLDGEISNREYANTEEFQMKCMEAGVKNTKRQASKFRRKMGLAFKGGK